MDTLISLAKLIPSDISGISTDAKQKITSLGVNLPMKVYMDADQLRKAIAHYGIDGFLSRSKLTGEYYIRNLHTAGVI